MTWYKCLKCGHRKYVERETKLIRCTNYKCRSYWMMPEETYKKIVKTLAKQMRGENTSGEIITFTQILEENGISGQPIKTLYMAAHIFKEAEKIKPSL